MTLRRTYKKACNSCINCRFKQPANTQSMCDGICATCSKGTKQYVPPAPSHPYPGGNKPNGNSYGMNFESGTGTVTCYNWKDPPPGPPTPAPPSVQGRCGSNVYPAGNLSALGIDYDAAIPFAWFPKGNGNYGNCDDCGIKCSTYYSSNSYVYYNGAPLCYNITSRLTGITKTIRVNDGCGAFTWSLGRGKRGSAPVLNEEEGHGLRHLIPSFPIVAPWYRSRLQAATAPTRTSDSLSAGT